MTRCPHCGNDHCSNPSAEARCPHCNWTAGEAQAWVAIARMSNLADAGYFADAIEAHGFESRVFHRQDFNALDGFWENYYELAARRHQSQSAIQALREELAAFDPTDSREADDSALSQRFTLPTSGPRLIHVVTPLICAALAGGIAYWVGRSGIARLDRLEPSTRLWHVVAESPPFWSEPQRGVPRRCLRFDPITRSVFLEEDYDGDGSVDHQRQFRAVP